MYDSDDDKKEWILAIATLVMCAISACMSVVSLFVKFKLLR
jgi:hypothetical protein